MKNQKWGLLLVSFVLMLLLTACSNAASNFNSTAPNNQPKTTIKVATAAMPKPFTYANDKGELDGYDIQKVKKIGGMLPQYTIHFNKTEFASIFAGLDSGRYQVAVNNLTSNPQRQQQYLFSDPYFENQFGIIVKQGRTDIKTLADLGGKTTVILPGSNYAAASTVWL